MYQSAVLTALLPHASTLTHPVTEALVDTCARLAARGGDGMHVIHCVLDACQMAEARVLGYVPFPAALLAPCAPCDVASPAPAASSHSVTHVDEASGRAAQVGALCARAVSACNGHLAAADTARAAASPGPPVAASIGDGGGGGSACGRVVWPAEVSVEVREWCSRDIGSAVAEAAGMRAMADLCDAVQLAAAPDALCCDVFVACCAAGLSRSGVDALIRCSLLPKVCTHPPPPLTHTHTQTHPFSPPLLPTSNKGFRAAVSVRE